MKSLTLTLLTSFAAANAEALVATSVDTDAFAPSRRMGVDSEQVRDAITVAIADLGEAKALAATWELEFAFDLSPSELLADKAREALENRDEPPPRNWRERAARRARDAAIERVISSMERAGKRQEESVKNFLQDMTRDVQDFATVEVGEWEQFFMENVPDLEESPAVIQLLEDPLSVITEAYWAENGDDLRELLDDMEAEEFVLGQLADADEFLKQIAEDAREFVHESFGLITETVQTVLSVAELFGIQNPALDTLGEFLENPQEFMKKQAMELVDGVTGSENGQEILKFLKDGAQSLAGSNDRRRIHEYWYFDNKYAGCWGKGTGCYSVACLACCRGYYAPWYWFGGGQCL